MAKNKRPTQTDRVLYYIRRFGSITTFQAFADLGILRLASRISELKDRGECIVWEWVDVINRFGEKCKVKSYRIKEGK